MLLMMWYFSKTRFGYTALDMAREESECYRIISENIPEDSDSEY